MAKSKTTKKSAGSKPATRGKSAPKQTATQQQYARFLAQAEKIPQNEIIPLRSDVNLLISNAQLGVASVLKQQARIKKELPKVSLQAIKSLTDMGSALSYAASQVQHFAAPPDDKQELLQQAHELRRILLASADSLAAAGVLPSSSVAEIHKGHGGIDTAQDCVDLAALFQQNARAVAGKTPVTTQQIQDADDVGTRLLGLLKPSGAKKPKAGGDPLAAAVDARDRLHTLFERTWEEQVWRSGAWLFGRAVDESVPPLQSRVVGKREKKGAAGNGQSGGKNAPGGSTTGSNTSGNPPSAPGQGQNQDQSQTSTSTSTSTSNSDQKQDDTA
jgi:hypothetical protein